VAVTVVPPPNQPWPSLRLNSAEIQFLGQAVQAYEQLALIEGQSRSMMMAHQIEDETKRQEFLEKAQKDIRRELEKRSEAGVVLMAKLFQYRNQLREFEVPEEAVELLPDDKK
jgi:hypothetical protein